MSSKFPAGARWLMVTGLYTHAQRSRKRFASRRENPLSTILLMHDRLATTVLLFMGAVGLWGLFSFIRGESLSGSLAGTLAIGQVLIVVQGLLGALLYVDGFRPPSSVHFLYG